jgi:hypothetical protein
VDLTRTRGQLAGLDLSKVHALEEVARRAADAEASARSFEALAAKDREKAERDRSAATGSISAATASATKRDLFLEASRKASSGAGTEREHELHAEQLSSDPDGAQVALRGVASRREALLRDVRSTSSAAECQHRLKTDPFPPVEC